MLFLLAVLLFILTWRERGSIARDRVAVGLAREQMKEERVELDIWHRELQVWHDSLENQQHQLEQERRRLLVFAAPQDHVSDNRRSASRSAASSENTPQNVTKDHRIKNFKK